MAHARKDIVAGLDALSRELASVCLLPVDAMTEELVQRALAGADRRDDTLALVVRRGGGPVRPVHAPRSNVGRWQITPERHAAQQLRRDAVRWLADRGVQAGDTALVVAELLALDAEGHRGLFLVRKLSRDVELDPDTIGTTVRCWLPVEVEVPRLPGQVQRDALA